MFALQPACHIAFGDSYPGTLAGGKEMTDEQRAAHGMNKSATHEDVMIGAADTCITGRTKDGRTVPIFAGGEWVL